MTHEMLDDAYLTDAQLRGFCDLGERAAPLDCASG